MLKETTLILILGSCLILPVFAGGATGYNDQDNYSLQATLALNSYLVYDVAGTYDAAAEDEAAIEYASVFHAAALAHPSTYDQGALLGYPNIYSTGAVIGWGYPISGETPDSYYPDPIGQSREYDLAKYNGTDYGCETVRLGRYAGWSPETDKINSEPYDNTYADPFTTAALYDLRTSLGIADLVSAGQNYPNLSNDPTYDYPGLTRL